MRAVLQVVVLLFATFAISVSHGVQESSESKNEYMRFMVTLSEYQLDRNVPPGATEVDILETIRKSNKQPRETTQLSVVNGIEGTVRLGRVVSVTTAKTVNRDVTTRQMRDVQLGTILKLKLNMQSESILATIAYESSRFQGEGTEDSAPEIASFNVSTTQVLKFEKPCLIASSSNGATSYLFVSVAKLP